MGYSTTQLKFFADYIQKELGIIYSADNYFQLEKRLSEIAKNMNLSDEELVRQAEKSITGSFKQLLLDIATNNETSFFRDPKLFAAFENHLIPYLKKINPTAKVVRIWCAASSFGQEPYSLALVIEEMRKKNPLLPRFEIVATDISQKALDRAKEARYTQLEVQRGLPIQLLTKYFTKTSDDFWVLKPEIRINVQFKKQNLLEPYATLGDFDMVFCRNVLIYQNDAKKKEIVEKITKKIVPNGILVLGAAESLIGVSSDFKQVYAEGAVYFTKSVDAKKEQSA